MKCGGSANQRGNQPIQRDRALDFVHNKLRRDRNILLLIAVDSCSRYLDLSRTALARDLSTLNVAVDGIFERCRVPRSFEVLMFFVGLRAPRMSYASNYQAILANTAAAEHTTENETANTSVLEIEAQLLGSKIRTVAEVAKTIVTII